MVLVGGERKVALLLAATLLWILGVDAEAGDGSRHALLIANQAYPWSPLGRPHDDAAELAGALDAVGFSVTTVRDATTEEIRKALGRFQRRLAKHDDGVGFVYFAGHGITMEVGGHDENLLLGVHEHESVTSSVTIAEIVRTLTAGTPKALIVAYDACRTRTRGAGSRSLIRDVPHPNVLIGMSTTHDALTPDDGSYARALARQIVTPLQTVETAFVRAGQEAAKGRSFDETPTVSSALRTSLCLHSCPGEVSPIETELCEALERSVAAAAMPLGLDATPARGLARDALVRCDILDALNQYAVAGHQWRPVASLGFAWHWQGSRAIAWEELSFLLAELGLWELAGRVAHDQLLPNTVAGSLMRARGTLLVQHADRCARADGEPACQPRWPAFLGNSAHERWAYLQDRWTKVSDDVATALGEQEDSAVVDFVGALQRDSDRLTVLNLPLPEPRRKTARQRAEPIFVSAPALTQALKLRSPEHGVWQDALGLDSTLPESRPLASILEQPARGQLVYGGPSVIGDRAALGPLRLRIDGDGPRLALPGSPADNAQEHVVIHQAGLGVVPGNTPWGHEMTPHSIVLVDLPSLATVTVLDADGSTAAEVTRDSVGNRQFDLPVGSGPAPSGKLPWRGMPGGVASSVPISSLTSPSGTVRVEVDPNDAPGLDAHTWTAEFDVDGAQVAEWSIASQMAPTGMSKITGPNGARAWAGGGSCPSSGGECGITGLFGAAAHLGRPGRLGVGLEGRFEVTRTSLMDEVERLLESCLESDAVDCPAELVTTDLGEARPAATTISADALVYVIGGLLSPADRSLRGLEFRVGARLTQLFVGQTYGLDALGLRADTVSWLGAGLTLDVRSYNWRADGRHLKGSGPRAAVSWIERIRGPDIDRFLAEVGWWYRFRSVSVEPTARLLVDMSDRLNHQVAVSLTVGLAHGR